MRSEIVFAGTDGCSTSTNGMVLTSATGSKSLPISSGEDCSAGTDHDADHAMRIILRMRPAAHHQERQQGSEQSTHHAVFLLALGNFRATRAEPRPPHDRDGRRRS